MRTPSESRARFGKQLDSGVIEFIGLLLELALLILSGL
jgi:hypothetical protein